MTVIATGVLIAGVPTDTEAFGAVMGIVGVYDPSRLWLDVMDVLSGGFIIVPRVAGKGASDERSLLPF